MRELKAKGATLKATEQPIDTSSAAGKAFLDMLGVFAEFETNLRRERQMEGIAAAKLRGVYKGRPASIDAAKVARLKAEGTPDRDRQGAGHRTRIGLPHPRRQAGTQDQQQAHPHTRIGGLS